MSCVIGIVKYPLFYSKIVTGFRIEFDAKAVSELLMSETYFACVGEDQVLWYWDRKNWVWVKEGKIFLLKLLKTKYETASLGDFNQVLFEIQAACMYRESAFEPDKNYIQCNKAALNLKTLQPEEDKSLVEMHLRVKLDTELNLEAKPPMIFLKALRKALPDPLELYLLLQVFSYILLVRTEDVDRILVMVGEGQNGKSTILKAVTRLFRPYISSVSLQDIGTDRFAASQLIDKLANIHADIGGWKVKDAAMLKTITSGDLVSVQEKYKERQDVELAVLQIYSANKLPEIEDHSLAIARRFIPLEFNQVIKVTDKKIKSKLSSPDEREKILNLLVRIARTTKRFGLLNKPTNEEVLAMLEEKGNPIMQFMNSDFAKEKMGIESLKSLTYTFYARFCKQHKFIPKSQKALGMFFLSKGIQEGRTGNTRYWIGLELNQDLIQKPQEKLD